MPEDMKAVQLLPLVTEVVAAKLSNGKTASSDVASLIQSVYQVLDELRINGTPAELPEPAVPIKRSVTPDYIVCLEDGRQLSMLKRHLRTAFDMTPDQYRRRGQAAGDVLDIGDVIVETGDEQRFAATARAVTAQAQCMRCVSLCGKVGQEIRLPAPRIAIAAVNEQQRRLSVRPGRQPRTHFEP